MMNTNKQLFSVLLAAVLVFGIFGISGSAALAETPGTIVLVGNLQDELGHSGEWDPAAEATQMQAIGNGFYTFSGTLPAGEFYYKIAVNGSWAENYGQGGKADGPNVALLLEEEREITFYYNDNTHKIADSTWYTMLPPAELPRVVGAALQQAVGADMLLVDDDFDHVYSLKAAVPKGEYPYQVALGADEGPVYGANAQEGGEPLTLALAQDQDVIFYFEQDTHKIFVDDGSLDETLLLHDTYSLRFREPFEAVKTGQEFTLRLQARKGDVKEAKLLIGKADIIKDTVKYGVADQEYPLTYLETKNIEGVGEVDFWGITMSLDEHGLYGYKFKVNDFKEYGDDAKGGSIGKAALRGAEYFQLTVYQADYATPDWMKAAIIYQIFPDRFFNGNPENDHAKQYARGKQPLVLKAWNQIPANSGSPLDTDEFDANDFFGGDLEGIRQKLDYLQSLGVTVLYLNPIALAGSNHKYDTANYEEVDPLFGTEEDFRLLTKELTERGMYLMTDGVFNHVGDDSIYFDRYGKYEWIGAYEYWSRVYDFMNTEGPSQEEAEVKTRAALEAEGQKFSPYNWHTWFEVWNKKVDDRYDYRSWWGYDSLAVFKEPGPDDVAELVVARESELNNREYVKYILTDENAVAKQWFQKGISGWRLDVANEVDPEFWKVFRQEIKSKITLPTGEAPILLGESWQDASFFFLGDQFDSVMNYRFRTAVQDSLLINGDAAEADYVLKSIQQNYPQETFYALMNILDSHDTSRAIYLLGGGEDTQTVAEKGANFDYELGKNRLKLAVIFQMGYAGAPTIYYGDEAGQFGAKDPDCRRTYPWGREDAELIEHYSKAAAIRAANRKLFAYGDLFTLYAEGDVYVYGRSHADKAAVIAVNRGETATGSHV